MTALGTIMCQPFITLDTDTVFATKEALRRGFDEFLFVGVMGGRPDHSFANITLLLYATKKGIDLKIIHENSCLFVASKTATICGKKGDLLSLFPLGGDARGITTDGLFYPLRGETLFSDNPRGVSNCFSENSVTVTADEGYLLVIHTKLGGEKNEFC